MNLVHVRNIHITTKLKKLKYTEWIVACVQKPWNKQWFTKLHGRQYVTHNAGRIMTSWLVGKIIR